MKKQTDSIEAGDNQKTFDNLKNLFGILLKMKALCILCGIGYPYDKSYTEEP